MSANSEAFNLSINMTANTQQAKQELQNLQTTLNNLISGASSGKTFGTTLTKDINNAINAAARLKVQLKSATDIKTGQLDLGKFSTALKQSGMTIEQYRRQLNLLGPEGAQAFNQVAGAITKAAAPMRQSNTLVAGLWTNLKRVAGWQISSSILHGFIGSIKSAYKYVQDLNSSLNKIQIVTQTSSEQMARFAKEANKSAQALSTTTTAYTDAALIFFQQGLKEEDVKARTDVVMKMANVTKESASEVASQMTAIWNNFDDGSKSMEYYADVITKLGAKTASSSKEIAEGLEKFASIGDTVGLSYEYATSALATVVAETRQSADTVGTAFKTIFARLEGLSLGETLDDGTNLNKYSEALHKVGVEIKDSNGGLKDADQILVDLGAKWQTLARDQKMALAQTVAGTRQYTQLIALMDNWETFQSNLNYAKGSEGTLQKQQDTYAMSWEAASKRVKSAAEDMYTALLDDKFFIGLTDGFAKILKGITNFSKALGGLPGVLNIILPLFTTIFGTQMANSIDRMSLSLRATFSSKYKQQAEQAREDTYIALEKQANEQMQGLTPMAASGITSNLTEQLKLKKELQAISSNISKEEQEYLATLLDGNDALLQRTQKKGIELSQQQQIVDKEISEMSAINKNQLNNNNRMPTQQDFYNLQTKTATSSYFQNVDKEVAAANSIAGKFDLLSQKAEYFKTVLSDDTKAAGFIDAFGEAKPFEDFSARIDQAIIKIENYKKIQQEYSANPEAFNAKYYNQESGQYFFNGDFGDIKSLSSIDSINDKINNVRQGFINSFQDMVQAAKNGSADLETTIREKFYNSLESGFDAKRAELEKNVEGIFTKIKNQTKDNPFDMNIDNVVNQMAKLYKIDPTVLRDKFVQANRAIQNSLNDTGNVTQQAKTKVNSLKNEVIDMGDAARNQLTNKLEGLIAKLKDTGTSTDEVLREIMNLAFGTKNLGNTMGNTANSVISFGRVLTTLATTLMSVSNLINVMPNLSRVWNSDASAGEKMIQTISILGSAIFSLSMIFSNQNKQILTSIGLKAINAIMDKADIKIKEKQVILGNKENAGILARIIAKTAEIAVTLGLTAAKGALLLVTLALVAAMLILVAIIWSIAKAQEEAKKKARLLEVAEEGVVDATEELTKKAKEAKEAYEKLFETKGKYDTLKKELEELSAGTDDYYSKLVQLYGLIDEVKKENPDVQVSTDETGTPYISSDAWTKALEKARLLALTKQLAAQTNDIEQKEIDYAKKIEPPTGKNLTLKGYYQEIRGAANSTSGYSKDLTGEKGKSWMYSKTVAADVDDIEWSAKFSQNPSFDDEAKRVFLAAAFRDGGKENPGVQFAQPTKNSDKYTPIEVSGGKNIWVKTDLLNELTSTKFYAITDGEESVDEDGETKYYTKVKGLTTKKPDDAAGKMITFQVTKNTAGQILYNIGDPNKDGTLANQYLNEIQPIFEQAALMVFNAEATKNNKIDAEYAKGIAKFYGHLRSKNADPNAYYKKFNELKGSDYSDLLKKGEDSNTVMWSSENDLVEVYKNTDSFTKDIPQEDQEDNKKILNNDAYKTWARSYMAKMLAAEETFDHLLNGDNGIVATYKKYTQNVDNKTRTAFKNLMAIGGGTGTFTSDTDMKLIKAYLKGTSFQDFIKGNEDTYEEILKGFGYTDNEIDLKDKNNAITKTLTVSMETASKIAKENFAELKKAFLPPGFEGSSNFEDEILNSLGKYTLAYGNVLQRWKKEASDLKTQFPTEGIFNFAFEGGEKFFENSENAQKFLQKIQQITFANPIQGAKTLNDLTFDVDKNIAKWAEGAKVATSEVTSLQQQVKYLYNNFGSSNIQTLFKDDNIATVDEIIKLKDTLPDLKTMLDINGISAATLATYFNQVHSGILDINKVSNNFLKALDEIGQATNTITDSITYTTNFKPATSSQDISEKYKTWRKKIKESLEKGAYGDQELIDYSKAILGNENFEKYKQKFDGNLKKVEEEAYKKINGFGDTFYNAWKSLAAQSNMISISDDGSIQFNLKVITSMDDLRNELMSKLGYSKEMADAAIADAETYSKNLESELSKKQIGQSVVTLLEGISPNGKILEIPEEEIKILADKANVDLTKLKQAIIDGASKDNEFKKFKIEFKPQVELTQDGTISDTSKQQLVDQINKDFKKETKLDVKESFERTEGEGKEKVKDYQTSLDDIYTQLKNAGLPEDQIKEQLKSIASTSAEEFKKSNKNAAFYYKDGMLHALSDVTDANREEIAEALGIPVQDLKGNVEDAVSQGYSSGLTSKETRKANIKNKQEQVQTIAEAVALGWAIGQQNAKLTPQQAQKLYKQVRSVVGDAFSDGKNDGLTEGKKSKKKGHKKTKKYVEEQFDLGDQSLSYEDKDSRTDTDDDKNKKSKSTEELKRLRDEKERYHVITKHIDAQTKALEKLSKAKDNAYGNKRLKLLDKEINAQKQLIALEAKKQREAQKYINSDKQKLKKFGAKFSKDDTISNYDQLMAQQVKAYNDAAKKYNKSDQTDADKKAWKKAKQRFEDFKKLLSNYETAVSTAQDQAAKVAEAKANLLAKRLEKIKYKLEIKVYIDDKTLKMFEKALEKYKSQGFSQAKQLQTLFKELNAYKQKATDVRSSMKQSIQADLKAQREGVMQSSKAYKKLTKNQKKLIANGQATAKQMKKWGLSQKEIAKIQAATLNKKQLDKIMNGKMSNKEMRKLGLSEETIKALQEGTETLESINEWADKLGEEVNNAFKSFWEEGRQVFDQFTNSLKHYSELLKTYNNIAELTGERLYEQMSSKDFVNNYKAQSQVAVNNISATRNKKDFSYNNLIAAQKQLQKAQAKKDADEIKRWTDTVNEALKQYQSDQEEFLKAWETALTTINEGFQNSVKITTKYMQKNLLGTLTKGLDQVYKSWADLQTAMEKQKEVNDLTFKNYKQVYETSKLIRQINQSIDKTDNLKAQKQYNKLLDEVKYYQDSNKKMSKYDLEYLQKKYELTQAQIALEEAREAKNSVRLKRDSEGNYGYVYTADTSKVEKAEQDYEDKLYALQEFMDKSQEEMSQNYVQLQNKMVEEINALNLNDFANFTEYEKKVKEITDRYGQMGAFYLNSLQNITQRGSLVNSEYAANLADTYQETWLGAIMPGANSFGDIMQTNLSFVESMGKDLNTIFNDFSAQVNQAYSAAGTTIAGFANSFSAISSDISKDAQDIAEQSKQSLKDLTNEYKNVEKQLNKYWSSVKKSSEDVINKNNQTINSVNKLTAAYGKLNEQYSYYKSGQNAYDQAEDRTASNIGKPKKSTGTKGDVAAFDTGGYTGDWGQSGKFAILHEKEMVLNKDDTKNILSTVDIVKNLMQYIDNISKISTSLHSIGANSNKQEILQQVEIKAEFPGVQNRLEIEEAFNNLVNKASQFAYRI